MQMTAALVLCEQEAAGAEKGQSRRVVSLPTHSTWLADILTPMVVEEPNREPATGSAPKEGS